MTAAAELKKVKNGYQDDIYAPVYTHMRTHTHTLPTKRFRRRPRNVPIAKLLVVVLCCVVVTAGCSGVPR